MPIISSKLEKLKIYVYKNCIRANSDKISTIEVMFNPQHYSLSYQNSFSKKQAINTSAAQLAFIKSPPQELALELLIDGTSTYNSEDTRKVEDRVKEFIKLTVNIDGEIHQPTFLKVNWGYLNFDCRLTSVDVSYTMFSRAGEPLRAKLNTTFTADVRNEKQIRVDNKQSPDLTHQRLLLEGDNLPMLAYKIYNDPLFYIQLAKYNRLKNFRNIEAGAKLTFPPLENE